MLNFNFFQGINMSPLGMARYVIHFDTYHKYVLYQYVLCGARYVVIQAGNLDEIPPYMGQVDELCGKSLQWC